MSPRAHGHHQANKNEHKFNCVSYRSTHDTPAIAQTKTRHSWPNSVHLLRRFAVSNLFNKSTVRSRVHQTHDPKAHLVINTKTITSQQLLMNAVAMAAVDSQQFDTINEAAITTCNNIDAAPMKFQRWRWELGFKRAGVTGTFHELNRFHISQAL